MAMNTNPPSVTPSCEDVYQVQRPVYCLRTFDGEFQEKPEEVDIKTQLKRAKNTCLKNLTWHKIGMRALSFVPFITFMRYNYKRKYLLKDLIAGITLLVFQIPQGLAYGLLANMQPISGLYTALFPPLVYVFFGSSRHLSTGTFSILSLLIAEPVSRLATLTVNSTVNNMTVTEADVEFEKMKIAACATFMAGVFQLVMGFLHLGILTRYMSDSLISGITTGAAVHVITSQLITCLGLTVKRYSSVGKIVMTYIDIFSQIQNTNVATVVTSLICILVLVVVKEFINPKVKEKIKMPIPIELILVIFAAVFGHFAKVDTQFGIKIVGDVPKGIPNPIVPDFSLFKDLIGDAISLTIVCFVVSSSLAKMIAIQNNYEVDFNQELLALGMANVCGAFLRCIMAGANLSRNAVVVDVGMKSQVANLIACGLMVLVLLFMGSWFSPLPRCVLGTIIIVALKGTIQQVKKVPHLWKVSVYDFLIWVVSCLAVIFLDVTYGLATGFAFSILTIVCRTQNPESRIIGRIPQTDIYKDASVYPEAEEIPGIKIFRFDGAVYFANAETFRTNLYKMTGKNPSSILYERQKRLKKEMKRKKRLEERSEVKKNLLKDKTPDEGFAETAVRIDGSTMELAPPDKGPKTLDNGSMISESASVNRNKGESEHNEVHHIILDCSTWAYIDSVGIRVLKEIIRQYQKCDIIVYMAVLKSSVRDMFSRTQLYDTVDKDVMYLTVHDAVISALCGFEETKQEGGNPGELLTASL